MAPTSVDSDGIPRIDCHTHVFPRKYLSELRKMNIPLGQAIDDRFLSLEKRKVDMDRAGIDRQVISVTVPGVDVSTPETAVRLSKIVNDELSALTEGNERFIAVASLPMLSPEDTVDELERAINVLGLRGAGLFTTVAGRPIDLREFWPVYEVASRMGVPLFIHPSAPPHEEVYREYRLLAVLGFPFETTYAATRLVLSGLLEEYPDLKFVLSHLGGTLPYLVGRIDDGYRIYREHQGKIREAPSEYFRKMYLDTASFYEPALNCAHAFWGAERMLLGSDYPYGWVGDLGRCAESVERLKIGEEAKMKILHGNAEKILQLNRCCE
jgi:predicted TIM-barrel fold metal-dependent hydrolase